MCSSGNQLACMCAKSMDLSFILYFHSFAKKSKDIHKILSLRIYNSYIYIVQVHNNELYRCVYV